MRKTIPALLALSLALSPAAARAGWFLEGSAGQGWEVDPGSARQPTNLMATAGWQFASVLSLELGAVASLANVKNSDFDVQLRPMAELSAPMFPIYAKAIFGITGLTAKPVKLQYGGALGWRFGVGGVALFLEAGVLPTNVEVVDLAGVKSNQLIWIAEGRLGVRLE